MRKVLTVLVASAFAFAAASSFAAGPAKTNQGATQQTVAKSAQNKDAKLHLAKKTKKKRAAKRR